MIPNECCKTYEEWLMREHFFCSCGHVEWVHYPNGTCAHCTCMHYDGEPRPKTSYEIYQDG